MELPLKALELCVCLRTERSLWRQRSALLLSGFPPLQGSRAFYPFRPQLLSVDLKGGNLRMELLPSRVDKAGGVAALGCSPQLHRFLSRRGCNPAVSSRVCQSLPNYLQSAWLAGWLVTTREGIWLGLAVQKLRCVRLKRSLSKFKLSYWLTWHSVQYSEQLRASLQDLRCDSCVFNCCLKAGASAWQKVASLCATGFCFGECCWSFK